MANHSVLRLLVAVLTSCGILCRAFSQEKAKDTLLEAVDQAVVKLMDAGDIPGLSLVIIRGDQQVIRSYGYADVAGKQPVTPATLFEIGSCSKAFTALAVANLVLQRRLNLDDTVSDYLPWFTTRYKGEETKITIRQLLHHTSGIPWNTISKIPQAGGADALRQTVGQLTGQKLNHPPGKEFEYATINYDVLALVVQHVAGQPFETYLQEQVIDQLRLTGTTIGSPKNAALLATGYKIGFFVPRAYQAPEFKGNNAAGYVISNSPDMARWLRFQMGLVSSPLDSLAAFTQRRDETVPLHGMASYAMGWEVSLSGNGEIRHGGVNPNYTSHLAFRPQRKLAVAVLTNSNSSFTPVIGNKIMRLIAGEEIEKEFHPGDGTDKAFSILSFIAGVYILAVAVFLATILWDIIRKKRKYAGLALVRIKFGLSLVIVLPFLYGLYVLPHAMFGFTWQAVFVWTPVSVTAAVVLMLAGVTITYLVFLLRLCFPEKNKFLRIVPQLLLFSILSGLANMVIIMLVTSSLDSEVELEYLIFYYFLALSVYLLGRRFVQINLIRFSRELTYELRIKLINKIFSTSYQKFEKIDRGRVYTALNDDVDTVGVATNMFVMLITNFITAVGAFLYLATIAFWAAVLTVLLILTLVTIYFLVIRKTNKYYEAARDTRNVFMRLINGMIDGFKEISLNRNKKLEYRADVAMSANEYRVKISTASIRLVNASLVGETVLIMLLGAVVFAFPKVFPGIQSYTLMSFVIVLLYLIGPVNTILGAIPTVMNMKIAWNRIGKFLNEIPANMDLEKLVPFLVPPTVNHIKAEGVEFTYKSKHDDQHFFAIGPIDLEVRRGEILFIIGNNGSGKTTLAKLLTGLYVPDKGRFRINGETVDASRLGEYFSTVFSPAYLFEKLYNINPEEKAAELKKCLKLLHLEEKVEVKGNRYSTINLSGGQRKRLALLQCYLEDSPIYLFDEWAADQDPEYRRFFYRTLLPEMKKMGKIIIAISHDDHYFDVADRVYKMDQGKLEVFSCPSPAPAGPAGTLF